MKLHDKARKLAQSGASNADIFGELEISSGALQRILQTEPGLVFNILQGRSAYVASLLSVLAEAAAGEEVPVVQLQASKYLLERAEQQNKTLTIAHEMILLAGFSEKAQATRDPGTVTALLRASK